MTQKMTTGEYLQRVFETVGDEYTILGEYVDTRTKIPTRHNLCGTVWDLSPNKFLMGRRCPKCAVIRSHANVVQKSREDLYDKVLRVSNGTIELVGGDYESAESNVTFFCRMCENYFGQRVSNFLIRKRCPICNKAKNNHRRKTHDEFVQEIYEKYGTEYEVLGIYEKATVHIMMKHCCGHEWPVTPSNILRGFGCPVCGLNKRISSQRKDIDVFLEEIEIVGGGEYALVGEYVNTKTKVELLHVPCGSHIKITPANFLKGRGCRKCGTRSVGERRIRRFLENNNIPYEQEKTFPDCHGMRGGSLRYDFCIYDGNYVFALIEYQGIGHSSPLEYFGGEDGLIERHVNDYYKIYYCNKRDIPLILIDYTQYDQIEEILKEELFPYY